ncbi:MAG TPA: LamG-like jellyroll fold domain-containing protein [Candidatus Saccharimonadales bacterium]|nr:LamG-like jellyroll fold domain-containing protein [Candidatus Saccharimonadales bacterium]
MRNRTQIAAPNPYSCPRPKSGCRRRLLAAGLILGLAFLVQSARSQPALVGEWFNGTNSFADVSGYQAPGTHDGYDIGNAGGGYYFTNDVPPGRSGYSLYLNHDGIAISNSSTLDASYTNTFDQSISNAMTVTFWAKGWPGGWNPFVSKYGGVTEAAGWQLRADGQINASPCWTIQGTGFGAVPLGTLIYGNPADLAGTNTFGNDGKWHVYVGTYSALTGIRNLYVDGVLSGQETGNGLYALAPLEHVCIGAEDSPPGGSFGNFFTGEIYDVRISNYDWNTNEVAAYSALPDPLVTVQPSSISAYAGTVAQLSVNESGTAPMTNQWQLNGTNLVDGAYGGAFITGSTSNVLTISGVTTNLQGSYDVVVSNPKGTVTSSNATLTVLGNTVAPLPMIGNLVGEWLNGSTNFADVSGYTPAGTHDGYIVGAGNYVFTNDVPPGKSGKSLFFYNGDTGLAISNSSTSDANYKDTFDDAIHSAMTVMFWAKGWPVAWHPFVSKNGDGGAGWQLRNDGSSGGHFACWTIRGGGGNVILGVAVYGIGEDMATRSVATGPDGYWHQYIGTFAASAGVRSLYVDGMLAAQETNSGAYNLASVEHLCFGAQDSTGNSFGNFSTFEIYGVSVFSSAPPFKAQVPMNWQVIPGTNGGNLVLTWPLGSLFQATNLAGPWTMTGFLPNLIYQPGVSSPYTNSMTAPQVFYRAIYSTPPIAIPLIRSQ